MLTSIFRRLVPDKLGGRSGMNIRLFSSGVNVAGSGFPWLTLQPTCEEGGKEMGHNFFSFLEKKLIRIPMKGGKEEVDLMRDSKSIHWVGSSHGFLAALNSTTRDMFLTNPLTGRIVPLPPYRGGPSESDNFPYKVVLSHSPEEEDCRAVMILGSFGKAAYCTPGRSREWTPLGDWYRPPYELQYMDVRYSTSLKKFLAAIKLNRISREDVALLDLEGDRLKYLVNVPVAEYDPKEPRLLWTSFLVPDPKQESNQLFLVRRYVVGQDLRVLCDVYRLCLDGGGVEMCSTLGESALFVGLNQSFALNACDRLKGMETNSVYYSGIWYNSNHFVDIFDYGMKTCSSCYNPAAATADEIHTPLPWFAPVFP